MAANVSFSFSCGWIQFEMLRVRATAVRGKWAVRCDILSTILDSWLEFQLLERFGVFVSIVRQGAIYLNASLCSTAFA